MEIIKILDYQGNKRALLPFIREYINAISSENDVLVDIFSGSGTVSSAFKEKYKIVANDSEKYASVITDALVNTPSSIKLEKAKKKVCKYFADFKEQKYNKNVYEEFQLLQNNDNIQLIKLYRSLPTVWNGAVTPKKLKKENQYNLFEYYYSGTYFGVKQSIDIDCLVHTIHKLSAEVYSVLYACLFYAISQVSFSKDGHLAQPLNPEKNVMRHLKQRKKDVFELFYQKLNEFIDKSEIKPQRKNIVLNFDFSDLLGKKLLKYHPNIIYADPPYTDMQYSRYYHILNVAVNYNYPELTLYRGHYTKGLYTEGRKQSALSKKGAALKELEKLMIFSEKNDIKLVLSYAYPRNTKKEKTNRYTVKIEELIDSARKIFGIDYVDVVKENYEHANNRNKKTKSVYEYLIICGEKKKIKKPDFDVRRVIDRLSDIKPTSRNDLYNSNLYWSQKSYNIIDCLIDGLSNKGDVIFDPFMGSGVTILESIKTSFKRNAIGCDVNELPIFIAKTVLSDMLNSKAFSVLDQLESHVKNLYKYYTLICPICGSKSVTTKVIFDKPYRCSNQGIEIKAIDYKCPVCKRKVFSGSKSEYYRIFEKEYKINNIKDELLIPDSKLAVGEKDHLSNLFTPRNYKVLDDLLGIINSVELPNLGRYILISILHLAKITDTHSNSQWPLWIPKINCVEKNIVDIYVKKLKSLKKTISYIENNYERNSLVSSIFPVKEEGKATVFCKGSQFLTNNDIPNDSIDLIITDPPYMGQVAYSEYLQLYEPFTGLKANMKDEIIVSSSPVRKNKSKDNYFELLDSVFSLCSKKLKENHYMALFYHDTNLKVWYTLINILEKHGFSFVSQEHIKKSKTIKNILSPKKSLNGDAILFFINEKADISNYSNNDTIDEIEVEIYNDIKYMLEKGPKSTYDLYDGLIMSMLIENKWLKKFSDKYSSLVDFMEKFFTWEKELGMWRL